MNMDFNSEHGSDVQRLRHLQPRAPKLDWELIQNASGDRPASHQKVVEQTVLNVHQPSRSAWLSWSSGVLIGAAAMFMAVKMMPVKVETPKMRTLPSVESIVTSDSKSMGKSDRFEKGWEEISIRRADLRLVDELLSLREGLELRILTATKLGPVEEAYRTNEENAKAAIQADERMSQPFGLRKTLTPKAWESLLSEWDKPTT
ncbi:hypothetical protein VN12_20590 [Pirellula sp. SH-Sr6A]|uniref:hypothetical protein n=1 Tax=Pirellula sp. SH-Sr6A TaxID=1632865 RepID=UPI00078C595A|nr:hypothetical protein [Pirellula sp. SH-Sr6A]AMV34536.1 hypothetical protein VN12_20590 [Pirellula sp. SH-Sr6A]